MNQRLPYQNPDPPIMNRVNDLLARMNIEEKVLQLNSQLILPWTDVRRNWEAGQVRAPAHFVHHLRKAPVSPSECAALLNEDQQQAIGHSRLGIPVLYNCESLHGAQWGHATCFPQAIALAASWNPQLIGKTADAIGKELRAVGVRQAFAPVLNIARDPRWGRAQETYGEDPYLTSRMGVAYVKGLEGQNVIATPKHFAANVGDGGRLQGMRSFSFICMIRLPV